MSSYYERNKEEITRKRHLYYLKNKERILAVNKKWKDANEDYRKQLDYEGHLKRKFRITIEQYNALLEAQHHGCAICGISCKTGKQLAVDHDHDTGKIRGLLCFRCNTSIAQFDKPEFLRKLLLYLKRGELNND